MQQSFVKKQPDEDISDISNRCDIYLDSHFRPWEPKESRSKAVEELKKGKLYDYVIRKNSTVKDAIAVSYVSNFNPEVNEASTKDDDIYYIRHFIIKGEDIKKLPKNPNDPFFTARIIGELVRAMIDTRNPNLHLLDYYQTRNILKDSSKTQNNASATSSTSTESAEDKKAALVDAETVLALIRNQSPAYAARSLDETENQRSCLKKEDEKSHTNDGSKKSVRFGTG